MHKITCTKNQNSEYLSPLPYRQPEIWQIITGLDIGYVPAGPDAFFRWSGQFGPQQLIFYWPAGPVDFFFLGLPLIFEKCGS